MSEIVIVGCLNCGAIGDALVDELSTCCCYRCGSNNFMKQDTTGQDMKLEFIEKFFEARLKIMELK